MKSASDIGCVNEPVPNGVRVRNLKIVVTSFVEADPESKMAGNLKI